MNKLKYVAIQGGDIIAHLVENSTYGLVIIFLTNQINILEKIKVYEIWSGGMKETYDQDLLDLVWFPFPSKNIKSVETNA